jgi:GR25 family glycosyltransferase involved in LPS biosynthesis
MHEVLNNFYKKIYVIHWKKLKERKIYLTAKFQEFGILDRVEWVDQYDSDEDFEYENPFGLNKKVIAVILSHLYCYKEQLKHKYNHILILEDDLDFGHLRINQFLNQAASEFVELNGDLAFLSTCCNQHVKNAKAPKLLYYDPSYVTRCTGAYIVNMRCAERLIASMVPFHGVDVVLDKMLPHLNLRCLWSSVAIRQGSETGLYKSAFEGIRDHKGDYLP